jgi:penicillin-binding protein 1B
MARTFVMGDPQAPLAKTLELVLAAGGGWWLWRLDARVRTYLDGPAVGTTRVMAAPKVLARGAPVSTDRLVGTLARLGYVERADALDGPGTFTRATDTVELWQRAGGAPWQDRWYRARVVVTGGRVATLLDLDGQQELERVEFRPEPLAVAGAGGSLLEATSESVPGYCRDAILAAEDRYFFRHPGVNPFAILRALLVNVRRGSVVQGGSTVTQQLVKNAFLSPRRSYVRKVQEAVLAVLLEARASKTEILGRYLASVYLGTDGGVPVHGLAQGALVHMGKPVPTLDVGECALLAGMIRSPNRLSPRRHPEAAKVRRDEVLQLMVESGFLDGPGAVAAQARPLVPAPAGVRAVGALYVADQVRRELVAILPADVRASPGLTVYTAVDADMQRDAEEAVRDGLAGLEARYARLVEGTLQGALVAIEPSSGRVRALVGGRDYRRSQLDHAVATRRQPGSTFKPFVYLTAVDPARMGPDDVRTVASLVDDEPLQVRQGERLWQPANYDDTYHGRVSLADALAKSMNTATVRIALGVGVQRVVDTVRALGITTPMPVVPSLALGTAEVSLLELSAAYAVLPAGGVYHRPRVIMGVSSADGEVLYTDATTAERVLDPGVAYLGTYLLEQVIERGTGHGARLAGVRGAAAGKTGTTDDARDAWFVGFTPDLATGVWVGRDDAKPTGLSGSVAALPIWSHFVRTVSARFAARDFPVPANVVWFDVDPATGLRATPSCPARRAMPFLRGIAPSRLCDQHDRLAAPARTERPGREGPIRGPIRGFGNWLRGLFR